MQPIVTKRKEARLKGLLSSGRYFIDTRTGKPLYLPIWYGHRLDLGEMTVTENQEEIDARTDLPDLNRLVREGRVLEATIYKEFDVNLAEFRNADEAPPFTSSRVRVVLEEFRKHGFNVTREALIHNFKAWSSDFKSGYRDEENGYHLFTPCGCNPLSFRASSLEEGLEGWQQTYAG